MKTFLLLGLLAGCLYCWHRNSERDAAAAAAAPVERTTQADVPNTAAAGPSPTASTWHKRSIDRARTVASDVREGRDNFSGDE